MCNILTLYLEMNCFIVEEKPINLIGSKAALIEVNVFDTQVSTNAIDTANLRR